MNWFSLNSLGSRVDSRTSNRQMDKKRSKPSGAQFRKKRKEEEEKRAEDKGMEPCHLHFMSMIMHVMKLIDVNYQLISTG